MHPGWHLTSSYECGYIEYIFPRERDDIPGVLAIILANESHLLLLVAVLLGYEIWILVIFEVRGETVVIYVEG
jgi:hypothetical protein